jgi:hypothetical protein
MLDGLERAAFPPLADAAASTPKAAQELIHKEDLFVDWELAVNGDEPFRIAPTSIRKSHVV